MLIRLGLLSLLGLVVVGAPAAVASGVQEPAYTVVSEQDDVEIRAYDTQIRAETVVAGPYREALNDGFRILANYIFGGNAGRQKIAMTAPVGAQPAGEQIAMTAPVGAEAVGPGWRVSFVMPAEYTLETLPVPLDARVTLRAVPAHQIAALRFSGWAGDRAVAKHQARLADALARQGRVATGVAQVAQYNPPWTLPFLRRNEILMPVGPR